MHRSPARSVPTPPIAPIVPAPRALLFDLDDTLCDYASARDRRLRLAFSLDLAAADPAAAGRDLDRMVADSLAMHPHGADHFPELFRRHGVTDPAVAEAAMEWYRVNRFHSLALFADAATSLAALRPGRRLGLVTNGPTDVQREKIALLGVEPLVDFVLVSEEFGADKPDPAIFREALRLAGAETAEAVFVGDSAEHDVAGARAAGIRAVWVNRSGRPWSHPDPPPEYEVPSLTALLPLLGVVGSGQ
jgi:FMN hydrolase / 5-amino-6-(5-phospho-D-ribitylamino)uracil phosphatase